MIGPLLTVLTNCDCEYCIIYFYYWVFYRPRFHCLLGEFLIALIKHAEVLNMLYYSLLLHRVMLYAVLGKYVSAWDMFAFYTSVIIYSRRNNTEIKYWRSIMEV